MNRSLAVAAVATAFLRATLRLPLASSSAAARPASITRESSRSSSAVRRGTLPMSFRYRPMESFMVMGFQPFVVWSRFGSGAMPAAQGAAREPGVLEQRREKFGLGASADALLCSRCLAGLPARSNVGDI